MVLAIMVIPWEAVRTFKSAGFSVRDWFGDIASIRERSPEKPLVGVVVGHPEYVDEIASLGGRSIPIFTSPEAAAQALAALWSYSRARKKLEGRRSDIGQR